jgi:hypothetical protein
LQFPFSWHSPCRPRLTGQAQGCSGGEMEFDEDDRQFEVDDALCTDGKKYDLKFGADFQFIRKNLD